MTKLNKVFVCGAGGQTGLQVVHYLSKHTDKFEIHAGIYQAKRQAHQERLQPYPVQLHVTDAMDRHGLIKAMEGMDAVFIVPAATERVEEKIEQGRNYVEAAKQAQVPMVILLSMAGTGGTVWHEQFQQLEKCVQEAQLPAWCILRAAFYMDNLLLYQQQLKAGVLPLPVGPSGKFAPLDVMDVGIAVKSLLLLPEGDGGGVSKHAGKVYEITGPQSLTGEQMAAILAEAWGRELRWQDIEPAEAERILIEQRVPSGEIRGLLQFYEAVKGGAFAKTTQDYETICGDVPHDLADWAKRHALD